MSFRSSLSQRTELSGVFYKNSTCQTFSNEEMNLSLIASLQYVINFTNYYIYKTYLQPTSPVFQGNMQGEDITLSSTLSTPTIVGGAPPLTPSDDYAVSFTGSPTINNQKIEYDLLGEIKMCINELPLNFLLCDGSSYTTADYPDLFNIIGYTYGGSGDNFNVPNFESYIPIGANSTSVNGNPTSNFVYGNGQSGATNTETISYPTTPMSMASSLLTNMPTHDHQNNEASHIHASNTILVTDHYYPSEIGLTIPFLLDSSVGTATSTAFTNITVVNRGNNIQSIDPVSGLNGVNVSPPYVAVKYCICAIA
jgi:microcystin-dependent protein